MEKLRVGIIGAGQIAEQAHIKNYIRYPQEVEVVAIADKVPEKSKALSEKYNIPYYFENAAEMFEKSDLDIVSICTPNKFHFENVILGLENGCHVFCEKPPGIKSSEALKMYEMSLQKNKILAYNFHHRHSDNMKFLKNAIKNEKIGEIYYGKIKALRRRGIPGWGVFTDKELQGGGPLIDLGVHMLDASLYLMDFPKVKSVFASKYTEIGNKKNRGTHGEWNPEKYEVEDFLNAYIKFENGASLFLETSFALNIKEKKTFMNVELFGTEGGINLLEGEIYTDIDGELADIKMVPSLKEVDKHERSLRNFLDACFSKEDYLIAGAYEGYEIQRLIEAMYESAETEQMVIL